MSTIRIAAYKVVSSDGREWGDYSTKREAEAKARYLRKNRGGFRGSFWVVAASAEVRQ